MKQKSILNKHNTMNKKVLYQGDPFIQQIFVQLLISARQCPRCFRQHPGIYSPFVEFICQCNQREETKKRCYSIIQKVINATKKNKVGMEKRKGSSRRHDVLKQGEARKSLIEKMTLSKDSNKVSEKMWIYGRTVFKAEGIASAKTLKQDHNSCFQKTTMARRPKLLEENQQEVSGK